MVEFDGLERRKFVRIPDPFKGEFRILEKENSNTVSNWRNCTSDNISLGGICIQINDVTKDEMDTISKKENIFEIKMQISEQNELITKGSISFFKIIGKTIWNHISGETLELGVKFIDLDKDSERLIKAFIIQQYVKTYGEKK